MKPALTDALRKSLRRRCPRCGAGRLFARWFRMHERCPLCGLPFYREGGYYLGSIYFNYGLTAAIVLTGLFTLPLVVDVSPWQEAAIWGGFAAVFPLWFFPYARALWIGMDFWIDPWEPPLADQVAPPQGNGVGGNGNGSRGGSLGAQR